MCGACGPAAREKGRAVKRPTKYQRALLRGKGLPVPKSRAEARTLTTLVMGVDAPQHTSQPTLVMMAGEDVPE